MKFWVRGRIFRRNGASRYWRFRSGLRARKGTDSDSGGVLKSLGAEF
jgi:hypothetical protein